MYYFRYYLHVYFRYYCTHIGPGVAAAGAGVGAREGAARVAQVAARVLVRAQHVLRPAVATCVKPDTVWIKECEVLGGQRPFWSHLAHLAYFMPSRNKAKGHQTERWTEAFVESR